MNVANVPGMKLPSIWIHVSIRHKCVEENSKGINKFTPIYITVVNGKREWKLIRALTSGTKLELLCLIYTLQELLIMSRGCNVRASY